MYILGNINDSEEGGDKSWPKYEAIGRSKVSWYNGTFSLDDTITDTTVHNSVSDNSICK